MTEMTPKERVQQLKEAPDTFCEFLLRTFNTLTETILELGESDTELANMVYQKILTKDPRLARLLVEYRIHFTSILLIDDMGISKILKSLDMKMLALALKGTSEEVRNQYFRNMSNKAVDETKAEMEFLGPVKTKDVIVAQEEVLTVIKRLEAEGVLRFGVEYSDGDYIL